MSSRRWILPYRILNVKHDKKYFKARTNVHFLDTSKLIYYLIYDNLKLDYNLFNFNCLNSYKLV
jgi:hypothetical protein